MSEYHKIETLYERDENHKVKVGILKNPVYGIIKTWQFTEKIDGTNIRCIWDTEKVAFAGRIDNTQLHGDLVRWLYANITIEKMSIVFPEVSVVLYGEGYGAGIQKGVVYSPTKKFILFDVLIDGRQWLNHENICDVAIKLGLDVVPYLGEMTLEVATEMVHNGFKSKIGGEAEGIVGRTLEPLYDKYGKRLIIKLKKKDFDRVKPKRN